MGGKAGGRDKVKALYEGIRSINMNSIKARQSWKCEAGGEEEGGNTGKKTGSCKNMTGRNRTSLPVAGGLRMHELGGKGKTRTYLEGSWIAERRSGAKQLWEEMRPW